VVPQSTTLAKYWRLNAARLDLTCAAVTRSHSSGRLAATSTLRPLGCGVRTPGRVLNRSSRPASLSDNAPSGVGRVVEQQIQVDQRDTARDAARQLQGEPDGQQRLPRTAARGRAAFDGLAGDQTGVAPYLTASERCPAASTQASSTTSLGGATPTGSGASTRASVGSGVAVEDVVGTLSRVGLLTSVGDGEGAVVGAGVGGGGVAGGVRIALVRCSIASPRGSPVGLSRRARSKSLAASA